VQIRMGIAALIRRTASQIGMPIEALLREFEVRDPAMECTDKPGSSWRDGEDPRERECLWRGPIPLMGRKAQRLVTSIRRAAGGSGRAYSWRMEYPLRPWEEALAFADSLGQALAGQWGPPLDQSVNGGHVALSAGENVAPGGASRSGRRSLLSGAAAGVGWPLRQ